MSTTIKHTAYVDQPCERCGSKKYISRTWKEKIPGYSGTVTIVECSQLSCTNKECEKEFIKKQAEETAKREANRVKKEENDTLRKTNILLASQKTRLAKKSQA